MSMKSDLVRVRQNGTPLAPQRLARILGLTLPELAKLGGVSPSQLTAKSAAPEAEAALRPIARILATAAEMAGEQEAANWFKYRPIAGWGGKTAFDLVGEGSASEVLEYFEAVKAGVDA